MKQNIRLQGKRLFFFPFVVFFFAVHVPERGLVSGVLADALHDFHGAEHAVVHVVVLVHAVTAHEEQVLDRVHVFTDLVELAVGAEVGGIRLLDVEHHGIAHVFGTGDIYLVEFGDGKLDEVLVGHAPHLVALGGEVFEADPHLLGVGHQVGAPVVENLDAAELHVGFLHIDPVVGHELELAFGRAGLCRILDEQLVEQESHGNEVAVHEAIGDAPDIGRHRSLFAIHRGDEFLHRHRAEEIVAGNRFVHDDARAVHTFHDNAFDALAVGGAVHAHHLLVHADFATRFLHLLGNCFPQLAGPEFRIKELPDEARLGILLADVRSVRGPRGRLFLAGENLLHGVHHGLRDGKSLDALATPVGADLAARHAPHLLGVVAEERAVEFHAEAVDHEIFEALLLAGGQKLHLDVANANLEHAPQPEVADGIAVQAHRIIEKLAEEKDSAEAAAAEHHVVRLLGIGASGNQRHAAPDGDIVLRGDTLQRQNSLSPVHHGIALAEEAVPADIHAVAIVTCSTRDATDDIFGFEYDRHHACRAQEFQRCG